MNLGVRIIDACSIRTGAFVFVACERSDVRYPPMKQSLGCGSAPGILMALLVFHGVRNASTTSTSVEPPHLHSFPHTSAACVSISLEGQGPLWIGSSRAVSEHGPMSAGEEVGFRLQELGV